MTILGADDEGRLRALLDSLGYDLEPSILIGGWAANARVGGEISHDIDLIITDQSLRQRLPERLTVDAYFPYESKLGTKLLLDVGALTRYVDPDLKVEGWLMLTLDAHIATKIAALLDRHATEKGRKDARELVALIDSGATAEGVIEVLLSSTGGPIDDIPGHMRTTFDLLPKLAGLNQKDRRRYASLAREWVEEAELQLRRNSDAPATGPTLGSGA